MPPRPLAASVHFITTQSHAPHTHTYILISWIPSRARCMERTKNKSTHTKQQQTTATNNNKHHTTHNTTDHAHAHSHAHVDAYARPDQPQPHTSVPPRRVHHTNGEVTSHTTGPHNNETITPSTKNTNTIKMTTATTISS